MVNYICILENGTLGSRLPCTLDVPLQEILLEESSSLWCGLTADPFGCRPQSRSRYFPESNVIIGIPVRLSRPFTPQKSGWFRD
ncbi:unnamed protein product [Gulo gulo]|uniref:Uncharacterized protein n=1 Tax=Gulo gulo TaxID=48420 RepID=A0A9X9MDY6_GULGU|nr:unnamed protein product [Gulo gulo]